jgi:hypothetical protein
MNEQVKAVVDSFRRLTNGEQTLAYMEIEAIWKAPRDNEPGTPSGPFAKVESPSRSD